MTPEERLRKTKEYASRRLQEEVREGPRGTQARLAKKLRITTAHMTNLNSGKSLPGEDVLPRLAEHWGLTGDELEALATGATERRARVAAEPTLEREERYHQMSAVRVMGLSQGFDPEFVEKWEPLLDADEQPDADYLWTLMKASWARHQRRSPPKGDPFADIDENPGLRNTPKKRR